MTERIVMDKEGLEDFEVFLEKRFNAQRFGNDLIKATNTDESTTELDIDTPIKKIKYDIGEIESRVTQLINDKPLTILDQMSKMKTSRKVVSTSLKPSLDYLDMSYRRLQEEVLEPYEKAQKLQNVLSKVHQTSILLRDSLIYIHLVNSIKSINDAIHRQINPQAILELASLHSQLRLGINQSANLKSLRLIKKMDAEVVVPSGKGFYNYLSLELNRICSETKKLNNHKEDTIILLRGLHSLSLQEFVDVVHGIVSSHAQQSVQALVKTVNSIKKFPTAMESVVKGGYNIFQLESILRDIQSENSNTNFLNEYVSQIKPKPLTPRESYWNQVSSGLKKELQTVLQRNGSVGKVLQRNQEFIRQTIRKSMVSSTDNADYENDMQTMLNSIAILSSTNTV